MAITHVLAPVPKWVFLDNNGNPITNGGLMEVRSSLNPSISKTVYQDPGGTIPYPPNVPISGNGTAGPFYWELDDAVPEDLYFLRIIDGNGDVIYTIDDYPIAGGAGGGGGNITTVQPLRNIMVNNSFINNIGATDTQPVPDNTFLAPSGHSKFFYPDLRFFRSGALNATDTISFFRFTSPLGSDPFSPDSTPAFYFNYNCTSVPGGGETLKGIRVPLAPYVDTLANQTVTVILKARVNAGGNTLNVRFQQYFGTGGSPSAPVFTAPTVLNLLPGWQEFRVVVNLPTVSGKILGDSDDDGTYLELLFPLNQATNIDIAKILVLDGDLSPSMSFENVEEVQSEAETPRTGDLKTSMNAFSNSPAQNLQAGWIPLNDGTIGNTSSGATTRAFDDTWLLYQLIFDNTTEANCAVFDNSGTQIAKAGTAISNWDANNQIRLPHTVGRVIADRGASVPFVEAYTATISTTTVTVASTAGMKTGDPVVLSGGVAPTPLSNGVTYYLNVVNATTLGLAYSAEDAIANNLITFTNNGNGTLTSLPQYDLGQFQGENQHVLSINEMPNHDHPGSGFNTYATGGIAPGRITRFNFQNGTNQFVSTVLAQGGNAPHNNVQPTVFYNMLIKL